MIVAGFDGLLTAVLVLPLARPNQWLFWVPVLGAVAKEMHGYIKANPLDDLEDTQIIRKEDVR